MTLSDDDLRALLERTFWPKVEKSASCWIWRGGVTSAGYGSYWLGPVNKSAHVVAYERVHGPVPRQMELDHLCRVRSCVNPAHLEAVSHRENCLRGNGVGGLNARRTECPNGHLYTSMTARVYRNGRRWPKRVCLICKRRRNREYKRRRAQCG